MVHQLLKFAKHPLSGIWAINKELNGLKNI